MKLFESTSYPLIAVVIFAMVAFSGCYTVLKQSQEYYSDFGDQKTATQSEENDSLIASEEGPAAESDDNDETVIINRYYGSPWWRPWPYSGWSVAVGYSWYPSYSIWYDPYWSWADYYYWGGCYYPTHYGGWYPHYYPRPWYDDGWSPSDPSRSYGQRRYNTYTNTQNPFNPNLNTVSAGSIYTGRSYKTSSASYSGSQSGTKEKSATSKNTQRKYKSGGKTGVKPATEKKAKSGGNERQYKSGAKKSGDSKKSNSGQRSYKSSTSSWSKSAARSSSSGSRGQSKSNGAPRSSSGGRGYKR